ncbi:MAG TPA: hypothetical protein V6C81_20705 [Planktothrix sp.]|jgi:hypothetical protein
MKQNKPSLLLPVAAVILICTCAGVCSARPPLWKVWLAMFLGDHFPDTDVPPTSEVAPPNIWTHGEERPDGLILGHWELYGGPPLAPKGWVLQRADLKSIPQTLPYPTYKVISFDKARAMVSLGLENGYPFTLRPDWHLDAWTFHSWLIGQLEGVIRVEQMPVRIFKPTCDFNSRLRGY